MRGSSRVLHYTVGENHLRSPVLFAILCSVTCFITAKAQTQTPPQDPAPLYVQSSIVNSASPISGLLAPNTLATVYGQYLAHKTASVAAGDIRAGILPTTLPGTGVRVLVGGIAAPLLYVSPGQINFVVPAQFRAGITDIRVQLDNRYGPSIRVALNDSAPALFGVDPEFALSAKATTGELLTFDNPGRSGDVITLYATGLGQTTPPIVSGELLQQPVPSPTSTTLWWRLTERYCLDRQFYMPVVLRALPVSTRLIFACRMISPLIQPFASGSRQGR